MTNGATAVSRVIRIDRSSIYTLRDGEEGAIAGGLTVDAKMGVLGSRREFGPFVN